jgi:hypothetical protein
MRDRGSQACAAIGVLLLVAASLLQGEGYAALLLLTGLAFVALAHVLTPCRDQITRWWRERVLKQ